jgi:hypothetical protein
VNKKKQKNFIHQEALVPTLEPQVTAQTDNVFLLLFVHKKKFLPSR